MGSMPSLVGTLHNVPARRAIPARRTRVESAGGRVPGLARSRTPPHDGPPPACPGRRLVSRIGPDVRRSIRRGDPCGWSPHCERSIDTGAPPVRHSGRAAAARSRSQVKDSIADL